MRSLVTESVAVSEIFASKGRFGKKRIIIKKKDSTETRKIIKDSEEFGIF